MEKKKTSLLMIGAIAIVLSIAGVTYAFWQLRITQTNENTVVSSCFDVKLEQEGEPITLNKAYPILDGDGEKLEPYTFTISNKCATNAKYQINLESLSKYDDTTIDDANKLDAQYLKVKLNEENKEGRIHLLNEDGVEYTLNDAYESHKLTIGYLGPNASKTYELRLWLNGDLTMEDKGAMNKTYAGKITVTATYSKNKYDTLVDTILALDKITDDNGKTGLYEVNHGNAEISYTTDPFYIKRLQQTELRYAGQNYKDSSTDYVHNYVNIDGQIWRIIGLVNTPEGQRVKLVKDESIGGYSWDTSASNINVGYGVNEWSQSDLMKLLNPGFAENKLEDENGNTQEAFVNNSLYWNGRDGQCYNERKNTTISCSFDANSKMPESLKNMIEEITWNTGSDDKIIYENIKTNEFYNFEIGGTTTTRINCFETKKWSDFDECYNNDWLLLSGNYYTLSPHAISDGMYLVFVVNENGQVGLRPAGLTYNVFPSVYLKPDVLVSSGTGEYDSPYELTLNE